MSISSANGVTRFSQSTFVNFLIARRTSRAIDQSASPLIRNRDFRVCGVQSIPTSVNKFISRRVGGQKEGRENRREQGARGSAEEGFRRQNRETSVSRRRAQTQSNSIIGLPDNATRPGVWKNGKPRRIGDYVSHTPTRPTNTHTNTIRSGKHVQHSAKSLPQNQQCRFTHCRSGDHRCSTRARARHWCSRSHTGTQVNFQ